VLLGRRARCRASRARRGQLGRRRVPEIRDLATFLDYAEGRRISKQQLINAKVKVNKNNKDRRARTQRATVPADEPILRG